MIFQIIKTVYKFAQLLGLAVRFSFNLSIYYQLASKYRFTPTQASERTLCRSCQPALWVSLLIRIFLSFLIYVYIYLCIYMLLFSPAFISKGLYLDFPHFHIPIFTFTFSLRSINGLSLLNIQLRQGAAIRDTCTGFGSETCSDRNPLKTQTICLRLHSLFFKKSIFERDIVRNLQVIYICLLIQPVTRNDTESIELGHGL